MAGIVEKLRALVTSKRQEEHTSVWVGYSQVLHDLAAGQELDPIEVSQALESVGRSVDDLEGDLELYRRRLEWRQELDRLPQLQRDLAAAVKVHDAAKSEYDKIVPALNEKIQAAYAARQAIESMISTASMAEGMLRSQVMNNAIVEQETRLVRRQAELMSERQDWIEKVRAEIQNAEYASSCAERQPEHRAYHQGLEAAYRKRAKAFDPHIEKVTSELGLVESELAKIREAKLQP